MQRSINQQVMTRMQSDRRGGILNLVLLLHHVNFVMLRSWPTVQGALVNEVRLRHAHLFEQRVPVHDVPKYEQK